ncbi:MAG: Ig-like domain-containing protein [Myxococcales bacterium]
MQASNVSTVTITVRETAPVGNADTFSIGHDKSITPILSVLTNDSDAENDLLTAQLVASPAHASQFTLNANGTFSFTPVAGYSGDDSFTYQANDGATVSHHDGHDPRKRNGANSSE